MGATESKENLLERESESAIALGNSPFTKNSLVKWIVSLQLDVTSVSINRAQLL
jgi:hypothetical protein